jgi:GNAT superfamily N-acetyltransferase
VSVRSAEERDLDAVRALWERFCAESPPPDGEPAAPALEARDTLVAEADGAIVGFALLDGVRLEALYVAPGHRRRGLGRKLVEAAAAVARERGAATLRLTAGAAALPFYERLGFREESRNLALALERSHEGGRSYGSIHVQTDDRDSVVRAVTSTVPRLPGRSAGSEVTEPRDGWVTVYDDACDRDPANLRRLATELSYRFSSPVLALGVEHERVVRLLAFDRGRVVDEYLSVPEFYGPLPPGEVIALAANPTVLARLTGGDAARIRAVARTAARPEELPPARELAAQLADALGLQGADRGYAG